MYVASECFKLTSHSQTLVSLRQSILCEYDKISSVFCLFYWGGGGAGVCLICTIFLVVNLLTVFETFVPPVKDCTHGVSGLFWIEPPLFRSFKL